MSFFDSWQFRSSYPSFAPGDRITVYATGYNRETDRLLARVGDTVLTVTGGTADDVDRKLTVDVKSFNDSNHTGEAELINAVDEGGF